MFPEISVPGRRPPDVTAAFWFQIAVALLLVVLAAMSAMDAWQWAHLLGSASAGVAAAPVDIGPDLLLAVWLVAAARGLRRGSRAGYRLSLAGLVLPPLVVAALFLFAPPTFVLEQGFSVFLSPEDFDRLIAWQRLARVVNTAAAAIALILAIAAAGTLLTRRSRRYFAGAVRA